MTTMKSQLLSTLIIGTYNIVCGQETIPEGSYAYEFDGYYSYIYIHGQDTLTAKLELQGVQIFLNAVPYTYDEETSLVDLDTSAFPNDATKFPYVHFAWRLMHEARTEEIRLGVFNDSFLGDYVSFQRVSDSRRLGNRHQPTVPPTTPTLQTTTTTTTTTLRPVFDRRCAPSADVDLRDSSLYIADRYMNGFFYISGHAYIHLERLEYIRRPVARITEDLIPAWPSPLGYPYVDFGFWLQLHTGDNSVVMVGKEEGRTVYTTSYC